MSNFKASSRLQPVLKTSLSIGLPLYASILLGGPRTGLAILAAIASGSRSSSTGQSQISRTFQHNLGLCVALAANAVLDFAGYASTTSWHNLGIGYVALTTSIFALKPAFQSAPTVRFKASPMMGTYPGGEKVPIVSSLPDFIATRAAADLTVAAGAVLLVLVLSSCVLLGSIPQLSGISLFVFALTAVTSVLVMFFARTDALQSRKKLGLAVGSTLSAGFLAMLNLPTLTLLLVNLGLMTLFAMAAVYDSPTTALTSASDNTTVHTGHKHHHGKVSFLTTFLLSRVNRGSLIYDILSEKDSRRIAYFTW